MGYKVSKGFIIGTIIVGAMLLLSTILVSEAFKWQKVGATTETSLKKVYESNKVVVNTYTTKVQEVAQVPEVYKDDLKDIIQDTFKGRYGENGSQAVFQFIKEQNINPDPEMYRQIQQVMESGRNDIKVEQQKLVDVREGYELKLNTWYSGFWLHLVGYPKVNIEDYKILTTTEVEKKFESGKDEVISIKRGS